MSQAAIIAIVDDDPSVCKALGRLVRAAGMEPRGYPSAEAFLEDLAAGEPDCALLDLQMPGDNGLVLQERLRRRGSRLPIIFITAHDTEGAREQALRGGALAYLRKPLGDTTLLSAIAGALAGKASAARAERRAREEKETSA